MSDPYITQVVAQIEFDNSSNRFADTSFGNSANNWFNYGPLSPAQTTSTFNTSTPIKSNGSLVQDGGYATGISTNLTSGMFPDGIDHTIDISFKITGAGNGTWQSLCFITTDWRNQPSSAYPWTLAVKGDLSALRLTFTSDPPFTTNTITCNFSFSANTNYDVQLCRIGSSLYWFVDGNLIQTNTGLAAIRTFGSNVSLLVLGGNPQTGGAITGLLDAFRYTVGVGRNTSNYTPKTGAFDVFIGWPIDNVSLGDTSLFGSPQVSCTQFIVSSGFKATGFGLPAIQNLKRYVNISNGIASLPIGIPFVAYRIRTIKPAGWEATGHSTHDIYSNAQTISAGVGGSTMVFGVASIFQRNFIVTPAGLQADIYGTSRVEHYRRTLSVSSINQPEAGEPYVDYKHRTVKPIGIFTVFPSNHLVGGTQHISVVGFSATSFGSRIIPERQSIYPFGFVGSFGSARIDNRRKIIKPTGFSTSGSIDRWGRTTVYNLRQYIKMYHQPDSGLNPPPWSTWQKVENRNRVVATFGQNASRVGEPSIANNARVVAPIGISAPANPEFYKSGMVSHRVRLLALTGIEPPYFATWSKVYNNARVVMVKGSITSVFGNASLVKTRRYINRIGGFDTSVIGNPMISHRIRTITIESRYSIAPPQIKLPTVKLYTRYVDGIGKDLSTFGSPSLTIHFSRIITRGRTSSTYGSPTVRNNTPEVHTHGRNTAEFGDAKIRLQWRPINQIGQTMDMFGRTEVAFRDRKILIIGINATRVGDKLTVSKLDTPPYSTQTIKLSSEVEGIDGYGIAPPVDLINGSQLGKPTLSESTIYVHQGLSSSVVGIPSVSANTIRVEPGYQELLVGQPVVSHKNRTINVSAFPEDSVFQPSKAQVSPHTIWAVMDAPTQAKINHPPADLHYVNSDGGNRPAGEVFGSATVTLKHRRISTFGGSNAAYGIPSVTLRKQIIYPNGINMFRFGWHTIPGTQTLEQFESSDSAEFGVVEVKRPPYLGPQSIICIGLDSFEEGSNSVELFNRAIQIAGFDSSVLGAKLEGDTPYMWQGLRVGPRVPIVANGTDMSQYGLTWVSNRVRELRVSGFDSFECDYQLEAFDKRMKVARRIIPVVPRQITPVGISAMTTGTPNVRAGVHYIRPDGNADQFRKGAF